MKRSITTCLSFSKNAEEAIQFYVEIFNKAFGSKKSNSKILKTTTYGEEELKALSEVPDVSEGMLAGPEGC